jgi:hypothetical protein
VTWLREFASRLSGLFGGRRRDQELAEELRVHIDMETDANLRRGMPTSAVACHSKKRAAQHWWSSEA